MKNLLVILMLVFITVKCNVQDKKRDSQDKFDILPLPADSTTFYFKLKSGVNDTVNDALDTFVNRWYSEMLFKLKEPILKDYQGSKEIYRFTWLRSFHHPVSIRMEKQREMIKLFTKVTSGAGGYEALELTTDKTKSVTLQEYSRLISKIKETKFWSLPTEMQDGGADGAEWIVEIVKDKKYHLVTRNTPFENRHGNYRIIGEYLISISQLDKKETEKIY